MDLVLEVLLKVKVAIYSTDEVIATQQRCYEKLLLVFK